MANSVVGAATHRTPLVGKTLLESNLREKAGVTVVGIWDRGTFVPARPETLIEDNSVLVLAGTKATLFRYDELFCIYNVAISPVVIAIWESRLDAIKETVGHDDIGWDELLGVLNSPNGWQDYGIENGRG